MNCKWGIHHNGGSVNSRFCLSEPNGHCDCKMYKSNTAVTKYVTYAEMHNTNIEYAVFFKYVCNKSGQPKHHITVKAARKYVCVRKENRKYSKAGLYRLYILVTGIFKAE